jgi:ferredoxin
MLSRPATTTGNAGLGAVAPPPAWAGFRPLRAPHPPAGEPGDGPAVSFARSGLTVAWADGRDSLLELAEACDVPVRWSCRSGVCHTCETGLLSGEVLYTTEPVDPPGDGDVLICSARPVGAVVLDLQDCPWAC